MAKTPLTDLHVTSQVRNSPGGRSDGSEEIQLKGGDQNPRQPVCRNRIAKVIEGGDPLCSPGHADRLDTPAHQVLHGHRICQVHAPFEAGRHVLIVHLGLFRKS